MTANFPAKDFDLAMARSEFIDAYNNADASVRHVLAALGHEPKQLLSQNIDLLAKAPAAPNYSKERKSKVTAFLSDLKTYQGIRCDIVHGRMETPIIDGVTHAFFTNVQKQSNHGKTGLLISFEELRECTEKLARIAIQLVRPPLLEVAKPDIISP